MFPVWRRHCKITALPTTDGRDLWSSGLRKKGVLEAFSQTHMY